MARFKPYDYGQTKLVPVSFERQILPGTFEYTLNRLIDDEVDLSVFEARYRNDEVGAPAYDPAILLKVILYAYARGVTSSREIARLCRENVVFMALSADSGPHFTTIADFIAVLDREIVSVFRDVLLVCDELGLIGREMFAVDGVKLPSNASKEWSGTRGDFEKKIVKMEHAIAQLLRRHRDADAAGEAEPLREARAKQMDTLQAALDKVRGFLRRQEDKVGPSGRVKKSNVTDNDSAKMKTSKGVIQGYDGVAVVDAKQQIVVQAQAFGEAQEHALLVPMLEGTRTTFRELGLAADVLAGAVVAADAGFHTEANVQYLDETHVDGYVADTLFRKRDPRFATAERHKLAPADDPERLFRPADFQFDATTLTCICPAGKRLYRSGRHCRPDGYRAVIFKGALRDCGACALRTRCLTHPERTRTRQVTLFLGRSPGKAETSSARMKRKIDTEQGRYKYSRRLAVAEPVFANICSTRRLRRFSLRGKRKVNTQWLLYCLVHNIGKVQRFGCLEGRSP
jgi:transposase